MDPWSSCALELEESLGILARAVRWFLVTDSVQLRSFFEQSYGDKVLTGTPERVAHSRDQTAGALSSAAVDNWLLGMTPMKVISEQSSFGRSAALRLNGNASVFTVQQFNSFEQMSDQRQVRVARGVSRECRPEHPDNIEDLLRAWWWV